jgi:hypothetical protein
MSKKTGSADTYQSHDLALKQAGGGMTLQRLEDLLSDIRYQPLWREDADICADYYDNHQLRVDRLARMELLGIPPLITNLIAPVVNSVLGMEVKSRLDSRVGEADEAQEAPEELILALNTKQNEAERESRSDAAISNAYASQVKTGVGWVEVSRESDPYRFPYRVKSVHRNEIWWDFRATELDLSDARYLIRKRRFDVDVLIALMPEHKALIENACYDRFGTWQLDTELNIDTELAQSAHVERITNIDASDWRDAERKRATVYEVWYREIVRKDMIELPNGKVIPHDPKDVMLQQAIKMGMVTVQPRVTSEVRVAFYLGCHRLYDLPSPYPHRHFPYVPFFGFQEDRSNIRYGMIRSMISPQDVVNSADAKMHWMLSAKRVVADSDAIDVRFNTWRQVMDQIASPNAAVLLDPAKRNARFEVDSDFQLSAQQFSRRMQAASDIENAAGIYKAMMGKEGAATSGVGINSLIEQSTVVMSELNDNYAFARRQVNDLLFQLVKEDLINKEVRVPIKRNGKKETVVLNQRVLDPQTGQPAIDNDITSIEFKVTLNDVPNTASFKQQQLMILKDAIMALPEQMRGVAAPALIMLTDAPDKEEMAESLKRMLGLGSKLSDEEQTAKDEADAQAAAEVQALQKRLVEANAALAEQKVANMEASTKKIDAERISKMVEAMYEAMQSGMVVAATPQVAPIADEILIGAGYEDIGGEATVNAPPAPQLPPGQGLNAVPGPRQGIPAPPQQINPQPPSPAIGMQHGIETVRNDGVDPNSPPAQA